MIPQRNNGILCISEPDADTNWVGSLGSARFMLWYVTNLVYIVLKRVYTPLNLIFSLLLLIIQDQRLGVLKKVYTPLNLILSLPFLIIQDQRLKGVLKKVYTQFNLILSFHFLIIQNKRLNWVLKKVHNPLSLILSLLFLIIQDRRLKGVLNKVYTPLSLLLTLFNTPFSFQSRLIRKSDSKEFKSCFNLNLLIW